MNIQYHTHIYEPASHRDAQLGRNRHAHPDTAFRRNATRSIFVAYLTACRQMRSTVFLPSDAVLRTAKCSGKWKNRDEYVFYIPVLKYYRAHKREIETLE
jgi:hypothetical protein